jgi:hypothetical protein
MKPIFLLLLASFSIKTLAQPSLRISDNGRYLSTQDGKPFFWLADTAWELLHQLDREEAAFYLKRRSEQGFTVIQTVALAEFDGLNTPNAFGHKPLLDNDPARPNPAYFEYVDEVLAMAEGMGLYVALLPTWGDKLYKNSWGAGPEVFNPQNAKAYSRWLGERYKLRKNLVWVLGGDRNPRPGSQDVEVWRAMAEGITEGVGGADKALITFHPQPSETCSSSNWFHEDKWLDFNMLQTGHCRDLPVWDKIAGDYNKPSVKPVLNGEPIYEEHPVCFNANELGHSSAYDVRKAAWLSVFAGAFGHTYGCHGIWQFYEEGGEGVNFPQTPWRKALDLNGASQMIHLRKLLESRPLFDRVPDLSLIDDARSDAERIQATRGKDYLFVYSAYGKAFQLQMGRIAGQQVRAFWYSPRDGKAQEIGVFDNRGVKFFSPPSSGQGQDWVLVVDDAGKGYRLP